MKRAIITAIPESADRGDRKQRKGIWIRSEHQARILEMAEITGISSYRILDLALGIGLDSIEIRETEVTDV